MVELVNMRVAVDAVLEIGIEMENQSNLPVAAHLAPRVPHSHTEIHLVPGLVFALPAVWSFPVSLFFFFPN